MYYIHKAKGAYYGQCDYIAQLDVQDSISIPILVDQVRGNQFLRDFKLSHNYSIDVPLFIQCVNKKIDTCRNCMHSIYYLKDTCICCIKLNEANIGIAQTILQSNTAQSHNRYNINYQYNIIIYEWCFYFFRCIFFISIYTT